MLLDSVAPNTLELAPNEIRTIQCVREMLGAASPLWRPDAQRMVIPEGDLWLQVLAGPVRVIVYYARFPAVTEREKGELELATEYLKGRAFEDAASLLGIDPEWIRRKARQWAQKGSEHGVS